MRGGWRRRMHNLQIAHFAQTELDLLHFAQAGVPLRCSAGVATQDGTYRACAPDEVLLEIEWTEEQAALFGDARPSILTGDRVLVRPQLPGGVVVDATGPESGAATGSGASASGAPASNGSAASTTSRSGLALQGEIVFGTLGSKGCVVRLAQR